VPVYSHVLFGDESHHNTGRFRSVGVLTAERQAGLEAHDWYTGLLRQHGLSTLEFKKLGNRQVVPVAEEVISGLLSRMLDGSLRVDVLVWDTHDPRHDVQGRDDRANLGRMYYRCIRTCLHRRWPDDVAWRVFIDEDALASYEEFRRILVGKTLLSDQRRTLLGEGLAKDRSYRVHRVESITTDGQPLVQLADLLAGLAVVSRRKHAKFRAWRDDASGQENLFGAADVKVSNREKNQFRLLSHLREQAGSASLGVSLDSTCGLETRDPSNPLNFWLYRPQHTEDRAPRRGDG